MRVKNEDEKTTKFCTFGTATNIGQEDENLTNTHKINTESKSGV